MSVTVINADAKNVSREIAERHPSAIAVIDPPWDAGLFDVGREFANRLVFCDGFRAADAITAHGAPTWIFTWDCVSSWYTPNRPLRRAKYCLWYGDMSAYRFDGALFGSQSTKPRTVANSRGEYLFRPAPGRHLSDVFSCPITSLRRRQRFNHSKPIDWCKTLIANCRGDADTLVDLFAGSGAFGYAAAAARMDYVAVEIDPSRADAIRRNSFSSTPTQNPTQEELWP